MAEQLISLKLIDDNPYQDREVYQEIEELGRVIAVNGLEQKPKARLVGKRYQLKFGHRRKRAFEWLAKNWKKAGLPDRYDGYTVMPLDVEEVTDQEMFDGVVIENVHRDDLKVTEKARLLRRYKEVNPQATSEQIGLVFNMAPATVRGMDIFLDLPEPVQVALDAGEISMGTARLFHSMQRVAPKEKVVSTLELVLKQKGKELPERVIEFTIDHMPTVVDLWNDNHRDGKPRAGYHGWPLDMKKLPAHLLPRMNEAQVGAHEQEIEHLTNPPACTACKFYTKVHGSHFCGLKICFERKTVAWQSYAVEQASQKTKIAVYQESDGAYRALSYDDTSKKLFGQKHKDLRLVPKAKIPQYAYQGYTKLDDDLVVVVATGETLLGKLMKSTGSSGKAKGGKKTEKEKAEMRAMRVYRVRRKEFLWEFTAIAKSIFDGVPVEALRKINRWKFIGIDDRIVDTWLQGRKTNPTTDADMERRELIWRMIEDVSSHYTRSSMATLLKRMEGYARAWGVKIPKSLVKLAEQFDAEIESAAKGVSTATKG